MLKLFNYSLKQIHYIPSYVGGMVVNGCMKGVKLFLFEINYLIKLNLFIIHQAIKTLTLSIHSNKLSFCFFFFLTKELEVSFGKLKFWNENKNETITFW